MMVAVESVESDPVDEGGSGKGVDEGGSDEDLEVSSLTVISPLTGRLLAAGLLRGEAGAVQTRLWVSLRVDLSTDLLAIVDRVGHVLHNTPGSVPHLPLLPLTHLAGGGDQEVSDLSHNVTRGDESKEARVLERPVRHGQWRN